jgi:hypothetical protein
MPAECSGWRLAEQRLVFDGKMSELPKAKRVAVAENEPASGDTGSLA